MSTMDRVQKLLHICVTPATQWALLCACIREFYSEEILIIVITFLRLLSFIYLLRMVHTHAMPFVQKSEDTFQELLLSF